MIVDEAYKTQKEDKIKTIYCRIDATMHRELLSIRNQTGISLSELLREGARRILKDAIDKAQTKLM